jgi:3-keto-5-aminohexanoate cleavage enzyme
MTNPCIICVAITGSLPTKASNPAVPIPVTEQIESTHEAFEAGATIVHAHMPTMTRRRHLIPINFQPLKKALRNTAPVR